LWDEKKQNVFWEEQAEHQMSAKGKNFLAGMLRLTPDLMCFYAPYINSYKRFGSTVGAPSHLSWGFDNRHLAFRVIGGPEAFRIENRLPGADVNPYLALAACIAAGLYGIEQKLDLLEPPLFKNDQPDRKLHKLPGSLMEAVLGFEQSEVARKLFGNKVIEQYTAAVRDEIEGFMMAVTDWERRRYFEQI
jgi:glutamine synthetase